MTHEKIPLAGVIGSPISHSKSPALHNHWLNLYNIDGFYVPIDVTPKNLENVIRTLPKMGFVGVNVTIPYKEDVLEIADIVTDRAALIGAANTLIFRKDGKIHADNTDGYGFIENLKQNAPNWAPTSGPAAVLGAGGASRAVIAALLEVGVPEIRLANRTKSRAEELRQQFGAKVVVFDWVQAGNMLEGAMTAVNTTALGMVGKPALKVPLDGLESNAVVTDLVYAPLKTKFLEAGEELGCTTVDGLGMLLHQAVPAFDRWFRKRPQVTPELRAAVLAK